MSEDLTEWEPLYRRESGRMWRALYAYSGDRDIASDAVAEAFAQAIARGKDVRQPVAWVWKVAYRLASAELKWRAGQEEFHDPGIGSEAAPADLTHLLDALAILTPSQRAVVVLHDYADRPTAEVGDILGMKAATVHVHLSQGRKRLREHLGESR